LLTREEEAKKNLPDVLARWRGYVVPSFVVPPLGGLNVPAKAGTTNNDRTAQSVFVPKEKIAANGYDLSLNRYKEVVHEAIEHVPPKQILAELAELEREIETGMRELSSMLDQV
jgi:type I restriction enzyme M protein